MGTIYNRTIDYESMTDEEESKIWTEEESRREEDVEGNLKRCK